MVDDYTRHLRTYPVEARRGPDGHIALRFDGHLNGDGGHWLQPFHEDGYMQATVLHDADVDGWDVIVDGPPET